MTSPHNYDSSSQTKASQSFKKELAELLMETGLGRFLDRQALLNTHLADLQEKADVLSINTYHFVTSKTQKGWQPRGLGESVHRCDEVEALLNHSDRL